MHTIQHTEHSLSSTSYTRKHICNGLSVLVPKSVRGRHASVVSPEIACKRTVATAARTIQRMSHVCILHACLQHVFNERNVHQTRPQFSRSCRTELSADNLHAVATGAALAQHRATTRGPNTTQQEIQALRRCHVAQSYPATVRARMHRDSTVTRVHDDTFICTSAARWLCQLSGFQGLVKNPAFIPASNSAQ